MTVLLLNAKSLLGRQFADKLMQKGHQTLLFDGFSFSNLEENIKKADIIFHLGISEEDINIVNVKKTHTDLIRKATEILKTEKNKKPIIYVLNNKLTNKAISDEQEAIKEILKAYFDETKNPVFVLNTSCLYSEDKILKEPNSKVDYIFKSLNNPYQLSKIDKEEEIRLVNIDDYINFLYSLLDRSNWDKLETPEVISLKTDEFLKIINDFLISYRLNKEIEIKDKKTLSLFNVFRQYYPNASFLAKKSIEEVETKEEEQEEESTYISPFTLEEGVLFYSTNLDVSPRDYFNGIDLEATQKLYIDNEWYKNNYHKLLVNNDIIGEEIKCVVLDGQTLSDTQIRLLIVIFDYLLRKKTLFLLAHPEIDLDTHFLEVKPLHISDKKQGRKKDEGKKFASFFSKSKKEKKKKEKVKEEEEIPIDPDSLIDFDLAPKSKSVQVKTLTKGKQRISKFYITSQIFFVIFLSLSLISSNLILRNDTKNKIHSVISSAEYRANKTDYKYIHGMLENRKGKQGNTVDKNFPIIEEYSTNYTIEFMNFYLGSEPAANTYNLPFQFRLSEEQQLNVQGLRINYNFSSEQKLPNIDLEQYLVNVPGLDEPQPADDEIPVYPVFISSTLADAIISSSEEYNTYGSLLNAKFTTKFRDRENEQIWLVKNILYTSDNNENYEAIENSNVYNKKDNGFGLYLAEKFAHPLVFFINNGPFAGNDLTTKVEFDVFPKAKEFKKFLDEFYEDFTPIDPNSNDKPDRNIRFELGEYDEDNPFILNLVNLYYQQPQKSQTTSVIIFAIFMIVFAAVAANILLNNLKETLTYADSHIHVLLGVSFSLIPIVLVNIGLALYRIISKFSPESLTLTNTLGIVAHFVITFAMIAITLIFYFTPNKNKKSLKKAENK